MAVMNFSMSFKGPMMQQGKSKTEKINDLIVLVRNGFAAMDPDVVGPGVERAVM